MAPRDRSSKSPSATGSWAATGSTGWWRSSGHAWGARRLYALNDGRFFVTAEHPFLTEDSWKAIDPAATAAENPALIVGRLDVGDRLLALAGVAVLAGAGGADAAIAPRLAVVPLGSLIGMAGDPATPLFNLRLDGDHAYFADGLLVHNK